MFICVTCCLIKTAFFFNLSCVLIPKTKQKSLASTWVRELTFVWICGRIWFTQNLAPQDISLSTLWTFAGHTLPHHQISSSQSFIVSNCILSLPKRVFYRHKRRNTEKDEKTLSHVTQNEFFSEERRWVVWAFFMSQKFRSPSHTQFLTWWGLGRCPMLPVCQPAEAGSYLCLLSSAWVLWGQHCTSPMFCGTNGEEQHTSTSIHCYANTSLSFSMFLYE